MIRARRVEGAGRVGGMEGGGEDGKPREILLHLVWKTRDSVVSTQVSGTEFTFIIRRHSRFDEIWFADMCKMRTNENSKTE